MNAQEQESAGQVARVIYEQLARLPVPELGFSFLSLSGACKFLYSPNSLQFTILARNKKRVNRIVIRQRMDLYDIEFWECRVLNKDPYVINEKRAENTNIFVEDMPSVLARVLGMI